MNTYQATVQFDSYDCGDQVHDRSNNVYSVKADSLALATLKVIDILNKRRETPNSMSVYLQKEK